MLDSLCWKFASVSVIETHLNKPSSDGRHPSSDGLRAALRIEVSILASIL